MGEKIDRLVEKLKTYQNGDAPFTFVLDDISGNSFVEDPYAPNKDEAMTITKYKRTKEQDQALGFDETQGNYLQWLHFKHFFCMHCGFPGESEMKVASPSKLDFPKFAV